MDYQNNVTSAIAVLKRNDTLGSTLAFITRTYILFIFKLDMNVRQYKF